MRSRLDGPGLFLLNGFFLRTGLRAIESGIDSRVFDVIAIIAKIVSVVPGLAVAISGV